MIKRLLFCTALGLVFVFSQVGCSEQNSAEPFDTDNMQLSDNTESGEAPATEQDTESGDTGNTIALAIGDKKLTATLADNTSVAALKELLQKGPLTIKMSDYGNMEKVGPIGTSLPRNDTQITTEAGDIILYQGNSLVIYYDQNSWNFTRIGRIDGVMQAELKNILGDGDVAVTFSLN